jgi:hypothetical protein
MRLNSKATKSSLIVAVALGMLGAACAGNSGDVSQFDCAEESLPGDFVRLSGGTYASSEFPIRSDKPGPREFGLSGASFAFWKESVDSVPFDAPTHIVCEALVFESADGAASFLGSLRPEGASIASTTLAWPVGAAFDVKEVPLEGYGEGRAFVSIETGGEKRTIVSLYHRDGKLIRAIHAGGPGEQLAPGQLVPALLSIAQMDD